MVGVAKESSESGTAPLVPDDFQLVVQLAAHPQMKPEHLAAIRATCLRANLLDRPFWLNILGGGNGNIFNQGPPLFDLQSLLTSPLTPPPRPEPPTPAELASRIAVRAIKGHQIIGHRFAFDVEFDDNSRQTVELCELVVLPDDDIDRVDECLLAYMSEHRQIKTKVEAELHRRRYVKRKAFKARKRPGKKARKREERDERKDAHESERLLDDAEVASVDGVEEEKEEEERPPKRQKREHRAPLHADEEEAGGDVMERYDAAYQRKRNDLSSNTTPGGSP